MAVVSHDSADRLRRAAPGGRYAAVGPRFLLLTALACGPVFAHDCATAQAVPPSAVPPGAPDTIERVAWLAGCWEARASGRVYQEEQWMMPRHGVMIGMSRAVRGERVTGYEALRIFERDHRLVYAAHPSEQAPAEFTSTSVADDVVVFENPEHDFPQRIVYRRTAPDSLHALVDGPIDGARRSITFRMERVACPAPTRGASLTNVNQHLRAHAMAGALDQPSAPDRPNHIRSAGV